jgi:hypothetical protein
LAAFGAQKEVGQTPAPGAERIHGLADKFFGEGGQPRRVEQRIVAGDQHHWAGQHDHARPVREAQRPVGGPDGRGGRYAEALQKGTGIVGERWGRARGQGAHDPLGHQARVALRQCRMLGERAAWIRGFGLLDRGNNRFAHEYVAPTST